MAGLRLTQLRAHLNALALSRESRLAPARVCYSCTRAGPLFPGRACFLPAKMAMRKLLLLFLLPALCIPLYILTQGKTIKRKADRTLASVTSVLPVDQGKLTKVILKIFRENKPSSKKLARFALTQVGEENFPAEYQLAHYNAEESIARYLSIPPERRKLDFYLYDFSDADNQDSYWLSEYYEGNKPAPFRCNFIIHLEPQGGGTLVEIFEFAPRVWVGKKFAIDRHGPGQRLDIRDVAPTTSDRVELLDLLKEAAR